MARDENVSSGPFASDAQPLLESRFEDLVRHGIPASQPETRSTSGNSIPSASRSSGSAQIVLSNSGATTSQSAGAESRRGPPPPWTALSPQRAPPGVSG